jgi:hypothetical protein
MPTASRRRTTWAIAVSALAHLGVLVAALMQRPTLPPQSLDVVGPPEPIIPVLILPRTPAPLAGYGSRPEAIQLHRHPQRNLSPETSVAPVTLPASKPAEPPVQSQAPTVLKPAQPAPIAPPDAVSATLRAMLGCAEARTASMSRDDRAGCLERLGRGARDEPYLAPALSPEKRALLDQAGAAKMAKKLTAERALPGARPETGKAEPQDYSGEPDVATNAVAAPTYPPSKRAAKVLQRLPP